MWWLIICGIVVVLFMFLMYSSVRATDLADARMKQLFAEHLARENAARMDGSVVQPCGYSEGTKYPLL